CSASEHPPLQRADGTFANAPLFSFGSRQVSRQLPPQPVVAFQLSNLKLDVHRDCSGWVQAGPDGSRGESPLQTTRPCLRPTRGGPLPSFLAMPLPDSGVFIASQFSTGLRFRLLRVFD